MCDFERTDKFLFNSSILKESQTRGQTNHLRLAKTVFISAKFL